MSTDQNRAPTRIFIRLLGPVEIQAEAQATHASPRLISLPSRKTRALLAYLAATLKPHRRQRLQEWFCPSAADPAATLRWHISRIRRALGDDSLLAEADSVRFNSQVAHVDCAEFERALGGDLSAQSLPSLMATMEAYRGEFLAGLSLPDAPEFELWLLGERARLRQLHERGLAELVARLIARELFEPALQWARQFVQSNPLSEEAHAHLIWLYARTGQRQAALEQFERCQALLRQELAVEPTPELLALRAEVLGGQVGRPRPGQRVRLAQVEELRPPHHLVGREAELERLHSIWRAAEEGRGSVMLVEAEAGGGKTMLVHAFAQALPGAIFLDGQCYESTRALPYHPWVELMEARLARLDDEALRRCPASWLDQVMRLAPGLAERLGRKAPPPPPATSGDLERLFTAVSDFLLRLPDSSPLLIFVDNLQWADEASLRLFHFAARRVPQASAMLVGAFRAEEVDDAPALQTLRDDLRRDPLLHLHLPPLTLEAITRLTVQLWPQLPDGYRPHVCAMLARATGGNPLFVTEVVRELAHTREAPTALPVPESVRDLVQRRLRRLPEGGRQVIEALAVLGTPSAPALAQQVSARSEDETVAAIDLGLRGGLLRAQATTQPQPARYEFGHDLMREAVVGQLSDIRRRLLHRRAATTLEASGERAATLAYHWRLAGDPIKEPHYAALAGEQAAAMYANDEAVRYLTRALELIEEPRARLPLLRKLGDVWMVVGKWPEAEAILQSAVALADQISDPRQQALCLTMLGRLKRIKGDYGRALGLLNQAREIQESLGDVAALGEALGELGLVYWYQGDHARGLSCLEQRKTLAEEIGDPRGASIAVANMGIVYWSLGEYSRALACYQSKLDFDTKVGDRLSMSKAYGNIGLVYADLGDYPRALDYHHRKLQTDIELGDQDGVIKSLANLGELFTHVGEYERALACLQVSLDTALRLDQRLGVAIAVGDMIRVYLAREDFPLATRLATQAIALGRALNIPPFLCKFLHDAARLSFRLGRTAEALSLNDEALEMASQAGRKGVQFSAGVLALRLKVALDQIDVAAAVTELKALAEKWAEDEHQAAICYELWRLLAAGGEAAETYRHMAVRGYRDLYARTPNRLYRQRYEEMTGDALPDPPVLPELPEVVTEKPIDLEALLTQVDHVLAEMASPPPTA
jgi:DNA-binding SARP family transcriptional activator